MSEFENANPTAGADDFGIEIVPTETTPDSATSDAEAEMPQAAAPKVIEEGGAQELGTVFGAEGEANVVIDLDSPDGANGEMVPQV